MSFKEFSRDLKDRNLKNVCILWGKEKFLSEWAENEIIKAYSNEVSRQFDVSEFDGEDTSIGKIVEACETLPLFSEKKLVMVNGLPALEGKTGSGNEDLLIKYLKNPAETTILVLTCGEKIDKRRAVYKAASKVSGIYEFDKLTTNELAAWIRKRFKSHKKQIEPRELSLLINYSGYYDKDSDYTLYHFENDISKVILHCDSDRVTSEDIENTVSGNINTNVFMLIDYIGTGDKRNAFNMLNDMFLYGQSEYGILALMHRQYENILNVKQLLKEGKNRTEMAQILKAKDFVIGKWLSLSRNYEEKDLKKILSDIYNADKLIKTGDMESRMVLELLIGTI